MAQGQKSREQEVDLPVGVRRVAQFRLQHADLQVTLVVSAVSPGVDECDTQAGTDTSLVAHVPAGVEEHQNGDRQQRLAKDRATGSPWHGTTIEVFANVANEVEHDTSVGIRDAAWTVDLRRHPASAWHGLLEQLQLMIEGTMRPSIWPSSRTCSSLQRRRFSISLWTSLTRSSCVAVLVNRSPTLVPYRSSRLDICCASIDTSVRVACTMGDPLCSSVASASRHPRPWR